MSAKQEKAIAALLASGSINAAAEAVGVSSRTLRRWLQDDSFAAELRRARARAFSLALSRLASATVEAVDLLVATMRDRAASPGIRVRAALGILQNATTAHDTDVARELQEIRQQLQELLSDAESGPN